MLFENCLADGHEVFGSFAVSHYQKNFWFTNVFWTSWIPSLDAIDWKNDSYCAYNALFESFICFNSALSLFLRSGNNLASGLTSSV